MLNEQNLKDLLYQEFARIEKGLSNPKQLEILALLSQCLKSVENLAKAMTMSVATVSQHLKTHFNLRLVKFKKDGNYVIYELADETISNFLSSLHAGNFVR